MVMPEPKEKPAFAWQPQVINHDEKNVWLFWAGCFSRD
jgi:hypothetical protein